MLEDHLEEGVPFLGTENRDIL